MTLSWQNVIEGHGLGITLTGMLVVFSGLAFISLFIALLPRLLDGSRLAWRRRRPDAPAEDAAAGPPGEPSTEELLAIIGLVLHAETERSLGEWTQLSLSRQQQHSSIWASAGKMRSLSEGGSRA